VYVFFRYSKGEKVMVVLNKNKKGVTLPLDRYREMIPATFRAREVISGKELSVKDSLAVDAKTALILEVRQAGGSGY
jgi:neopullulanase